MLTCFVQIIVLLLIKEADLRSLSCIIAPLALTNAVKNGEKLIKCPNDMKCRKYVET